MSEFEVTIVRHGYNAGEHKYRVVKRYGQGENLQAAEEALATHRRHGLTYPEDSDLVITVRRIENDV